MNRRGFLASLGAAFATAALTTRLATTKLLPESLSNELLTPNELSEEALESILIELNNMRDERGIPIRIMPSRLIVTPWAFNHPVALISRRHPDAVSRS